MHVALEWELTGYGWAECHVHIGDSAAVVTASDLSDALRSLVAAVCKILRGSARATASFDEEPGEYLWTFSSDGKGSVGVRIDASEDMRGDAPYAPGTVVLDAQCPTLLLGEAVLAMLDALLRTYGRRGYKKLWMSHEFPDEQASELRRLVDDLRARWR